MHLYIDLLGGWVDGGGVGGGVGGVGVGGGVGGGVGVGGVGVGGGGGGGGGWGVKTRGGGGFKNAFELLNVRALKFPLANEYHIFQCVGKIFRVEFQTIPLKFHTKYLTHTLKM